MSAANLLSATPSITIESAYQPGAARAFGCVTTSSGGSPVIVINNSYNVASVTLNDNSDIGVYEINFTTPFPDLNYAILVTAFGVNLNPTQAFSTVTGYQQQTVSRCSVTFSVSDTKNRTNPTSFSFVIFHY